MIDIIVLAAWLWQSPPPQSSGQRPGDTPPYEGTWSVEVIDNIKVMPDSRVTIEISGSSITGAASCNTYRGSFTVTDQEVRVGQLLRTMKACDPPRMSEEADFFALLNAVTSYEVRSKDTLVLNTRAGKSITARRSPGTFQHD